MWTASALLMVIPVTTFGAMLLEQVRTMDIALISTAPVLVVLPHHHMLETTSTASQPFKVTALLLIHSFQVTHFGVVNSVAMTRAHAALVPTLYRGLV